MDDDPLAEARWEVESPRPAVLAAIAALDLRRGWRVLDVGCGAGVHLPLLAECVGPGGRVVGLDHDPDRLALARELCAEEIAAGVVELRQGDLRRPPLAEGGFDLVWMSAVLHHEPEPVAALAGARPMLAPDGLVAVLDGDTGGSFPCLPWPPQLEDRLRAAAWRGARENHGGMPPDHFDGFLGRKLPRRLREVGLTSVRLRAFAEVDQAPLDPRRERHLQRWFLDSFGERLRPYLPPTDWTRYAAHFDAEAIGYLLSDPDFFLARMIFLATGRATPPAR